MSKQKFALTEVVVVVDKQRDENGSIVGYACPVSKGGQPYVRVRATAGALKQAVTWTEFGARAEALAAREIELRGKKCSMVLNVEADRIGRKVVIPKRIDRETGEEIPARDDDHRGLPVFELIGVEGIERTAFEPYRDSSDTSALKL